MLDDYQIIRKAGKTLSEQDISFARAISPYRSGIHTVIEKRDSNFNLHQLKKVRHDHIFYHYVIFYGHIHPQFIGAHDSPPDWAKEHHRLMFGKNID